MRTPAPPRATEIPDRGVMARMFAYLFGLGALLVLATIPLPHDPARNEAVVFVVIATAGLTSVAFIAVFDRLPMIVFRLAPALGSVFIAILAYYVGPSAAPAYLFFFFWVSLSASYFFGLREAIGHAAFATACLALVLIGRDTVAQPELLVAMVAGTLLVNGTVMVGLRYQLEVLVERLDRAARTDALTRLANRREFNERFAHEVARSARTERPLGMIIFDLDQFKYVNDRFGHDVGDRALERFAEIMRAQTRRIDTVARLGGEEFGLLAPETDLADARLVAERIRSEVQETFSVQLDLTVSAGVAAYPDSAKNPDDLLRAADRALYAAKRAGRNRVTSYESELHGSADRPESLLDSGGFVIAEPI